MTRRELVVLHAAARAAPAGARALEIGSYLGASSAFLAAGLQHRQGSLTCVDTWRNDTMDEGWRDTYEEFRRNTAGLANITTVRKRSEELQHDDVRPPFELVLLDGDHRYEAVRRELDLVSPWLAGGGVAWFHDAVHFRGVARTIGEALSTGEWQLELHVDNLVGLRKSCPTR